MQDWVRNDLIGDWAVPRHLIRSMVPFIPVFAAFMLFPGPWALRASMVLLGVLLALFYSVSYMAQNRSRRLERHGLPSDLENPKKISRHDAEKAAYEKLHTAAPRRRHLGHMPWRALPPFNSQTRCSTVAEKPPSGSVERRADSTSCSTRYPLIAIAAVEPAAAALITWARGSTTLPAPQTPGTLVAPEGSTTANPVGPVLHPSRVRCVSFGLKRGATNNAERGTNWPLSSSTALSSPLSPINPDTDPSATVTPRAASRARSSGVSEILSGNNVTSDDHCRSRNAW